MLRTLRSALMIGNMALIPSAAIMGWALAYGTEPVAYTWVKALLNAGGEPVANDYEPACEPRVLAQPLYSRQALAKFAAEAVIDLNTFDYLNWDQVLEPASERYMTPQAARLFMTSFRRGRLLAGIQREYLSVNAQLTAPAIITAESDVAGRKSWQVQVPVEIYYGTGARTIEGVRMRRDLTQNFVYRLRLVEQAPTPSNFRGIAISEIAATPISSKSILEQLRAERE